MAHRTITDPPPKVSAGYISLPASYKPFTVHQETEDWIWTKNNSRLQSSSFQYLCCRVNVKRWNRCSLKRTGLVVEGRKVNPYSFSRFLTVPFWNLQVSELLENAGCFLLIRKARVTLTQTILVSENCPVKQQLKNSKTLK